MVSEGAGSPKETQERDTKTKRTAMKNTFKKFGGHVISDLGEYIREYLAKYPNTSIHIGTDSQYKGGKINYATVVAMYDHERRDGVHYVFKRESESSKIDTFTRMWGELNQSIEVADYLEKELDGHLKRYSIEEVMVMRDPHGLYFKGNQTKLVTIHVDINPDEGRDGRNKSNVAYEAARGYLTGLGYRSFFKPHAFAASSAADMQCKKGTRKGGKKSRKK